MSFQTNPFAEEPDLSTINPGHESELLFSDPTMVTLALEALTHNIASVNSVEVMMGVQNNRKGHLSLIDVNSKDSYLNDDSHVIMTVGIAVPINAMPEDVKQVFLAAGNSLEAREEFARQEAITAEKAEIAALEAQLNERKARLVSKHKIELNNL